MGLGVECAGMNVESVMVMSDSRQSHVPMSQPSTWQMSPGTITSQHTFSGYLKHENFKFLIHNIKIQEIFNFLCLNLKARAKTKILYFFSFAFKAQLSIIVWKYFLLLLHEWDEIIENMILWADKELMELELEIEIKFF